MSVVDRFVCRREGHTPAATITQTTGVTINSYVTQCNRRGKLITVVHGGDS